MKTIFAKMNNERLPEYRLITKICIDDDNNKVAVKEPVTEVAHKHIKNIFNNYNKLKEGYNLNLVKPTMEGHKLFFEMAEGESFEYYLLEAINHGDKEKLELLFKQYIEFVDEMVEERDVMFTPTQEFKDIFGDWNIDKPQDIINIPNLDLLFSNIFVNDGKFKLIDYEWVFDFPIPKSFIIWRALHIFSAFHGKNIFQQNFPEYFIHHKKFLKLEKQLHTYAYGRECRYFLNSKVRKNRVNIILPYQIVFNFLGVRLLLLLNWIIKSLKKFKQRKITFNETKKLNQ